MVQDRLDAPIGTGAKVQGAAAGPFQANVSDAFAQAHDAQHGAKSHLGMRAAFEDVLDQLGAGGTDFAGPMNHPAGSPLQIFLVRFGTVLLNRGELARCKTADVRGYSFAL